VVKDTVETQSTEISNFYHTVAHEIKTPLTAAREFVALILDGVAGDINEEQQEILSHALDSCDDLAFIFNDLIESARLETGKVTLRKKLDSLAKVIRRCVIAAQPSLRARQLWLEERADEDLPDIVMDSTRMIQVVSNILSNAIKFTEPGGQISIFSRRSPTLDEVEVGVTDTGCGKESAEQGHNFDRHYQVKPEGDELLGWGLGLGLTVAKDIVFLQGGTIVVCSLVGAGSTFLVRLPIVGKVKSKGER
jgi:signal transduction histidine kinase